MTRTGKFGAAKRLSKVAIHDAKMIGLRTHVREYLRRDSGEKLLAVINDNRQYGIQVEEFEKDLANDPMCSILDHGYLESHLRVTVWLLDWHDCEIGEYTKIASHERHYATLYDGTSESRTFKREGTLWKRTE